MADTVKLWQWQPDLRGEHTIPEVRPPRRSLQPGEQIDRYRVRSMICAGQNARVYEARHVCTKRAVALKVLHTHYSNDLQRRVLFDAEVLSLAAVQHRNVVTLVDAGLTPKGQIFIITELLHGHTLREAMLDTGRLPLLKTLRLLAQITDGVAAAHEVGVIHRDLKPENIFVTHDGVAKVLDLGTAKLVGLGLTTSGTVIDWGTAGYIAPEVIRGERVTVRADIYCVGLIAYECLAGRHALVPDGRLPRSQELLQRQLSYSPAPLRSAPLDLWRVIERALDKDPSKRWGSAHEFASVLREIQARVGGTDEVGAPPTSGRRRKRRYRLHPGYAFGTVGMGFALGAVVFASRPASAPAPAPLVVSVEAARPAPPAPSVIPVGRTPSALAAPIASAPEPRPRTTPSPPETKPEERSARKGERER